MARAKNHLVLLEPNKAWFVSECAPRFQTRDVTMPESESRKCVPSTVEMQMVGGNPRSKMIPLNPQPV